MALNIEYMTNAQLLLRTVEKTSDALKLGRELLDWGFRHGEKISPEEIKRLRRVRELLQEGVCAATELDTRTRAQTIIPDE